MEQPDTPRSRSPSPKSPPPSVFSKVKEVVTEIVTEAPSGRLYNKGLLVIYLSLALWFGWLLIPSPSHDRSSISGKSSTGTAALHNYFGKFEGFSECNIRAVELYAAPPKDHLGFYEFGTFCHDRKHLLEALSEGGRVGFDAPYTSRGCNYRWFDVQEICFILERFEALIFIGDDPLLTIYAGLNILLRQDLALGALDTSSMDHSLQDQCRCTNQFIKQDCRQHHLTDSDKLTTSDHAGSPYFCNRIRHAFLRTESAQPDLTTIEKIKQLVPQAPRSRYRPIPIIHSLSPSTVSPIDAATSLLKFLDLADDSGRNTPMLWIGPTAAGHVELKGRKGNQEIWDFDRKMAATAAENDVDVLGMWNMTVQATSWDGMRFGEKVAVTQATMVLNWLGRVESS